MSQEVDEMIRRIAAWPNEASPAFPVTGTELHTLIKGAKEVVANDDIVRAVRLILVDHQCAFMLRPIVMMVFHIVDERVAQFASGPDDT